MDATNHDLILSLDTEHDFRVVSCRITEGLSQLTHAEVELALCEDLPVEQLLESEASLVLKIDGRDVRAWTLHVGRGGYDSVVRGELRYRLHLYPKLWLLSHTLDTRKFRNLTARQIVTKVLNQGEIAHQWQITQQLAERKYCVQYSESNLAFVSRLLEFEGIYYSFTDDGTLILADWSGASPEVSFNGRSVFELIPESDAMTWDEVGVFELKTGRQAVSGKATVNDFNWKKPSVALLKSASDARDADLEVYHYPTGYRRPDQGERLARLRLEALRVPARFIRGRANVPTFAPAHLCRLDGRMPPRFVDTYLLVGIEHHFQNLSFKESTEGEMQGFGYRSSFHGIPQSVPYRPPLVTPHPEIAGCHTAMVRGPEGEEIHTDKYGRCRVQFHWDREAVGTDEDSRWIRMLQETASGTVLSRIGWEISVAYIDGDPDRPVGLARQINGEMIPEYSQPANKTRMTIKTPTSPSTGGYNELRLEDAADNQHFDWHAQKDLNLRVMNDRSEQIGANETRSIGVNLTHAVGHDQTWSIGSNLDTTVGAVMTLVVDNDRQKSVGGNELIEVGEGSELVVKLNDVENVAGMRKTTVGEAGLGTISRQIGIAFARTVGGANIVTGGTITTHAGRALTETIGGSKLVTASGSRATEATTDLEVTISGSKIVITGDDMGYQATTSMAEVAGSATLKSVEQLNIWGDVIELEAASSLDLIKGGLRIAMTPGSTSIEGKLKLDAGSNVESKGSIVNLTK